MRFISKEAITRRFQLFPTVIGMGNFISTVEDYKLDGSPNSTGQDTRGANILGHSMVPLILYAG